MPSAKTRIRQLVERYRNWKVTAVPRQNPDAAIALTAWGWLDKLYGFDDAHMTASSTRGGIAGRNAHRSDAMTTISPSVPTSSMAAGVDRFVQGLLRHWLLFIGLVLGIWTILPWLAPVLMHLGWYLPAWWIYFIYGLFCHQLPERSWFLFGPSFTPTLAEIQAASGVGANFLALRHFLGTPTLGWKLAWSDRMVSFYGGWFLFTLLYGLLRGRVRGLRPIGRGLRWQVALLLMLPMAIDGITHMISDLWGVTTGFRQSNAWLVVLTGNVPPPAFYTGDAWGSFNSVARLVTGLLAAFGLIFWLLPLLDRTLRRTGSFTTEANEPQGREAA